MNRKPNTKAQKPKLATTVVSSMDERRIEKLRRIKSKLEQGLHVQNRDLQTWLPKEAYESIAQTWEYEKERRTAMYAEKPSEVKEYEERLAKAIFTLNRAEHFSTKGKHATAKSLSNQAESQFENAIEWLQESYGANPGIRSWFDRDIDANECTLDPDGVPRVVTSRSLVRQKGVSTQSIADIKLDVVERVLEEFSSTPADEAQLQKARKKLEALLNMPRLDDTDI